MPVENDPISSLLRKVTLDPATTKVLTILFSAILIYATAERARHDWHVVSLLVIYSTALGYSIFSLAVVLFKKPEEIGESACLKKIFCGRKVYWHEIQTTAAFTLAVAHFSTFTIAAIGEIYRDELHLVFTIFNIILFAMEWRLAANTGKKFVLEENLRSHRNCLEIILGPFHCFPTFFNLVRKAMFVAAAILLATSPLMKYFKNAYYFHCAALVIVASFFLFVLQLCRALRQRNSVSACGDSGSKWQTYFMLIITSHAFLAVLCLSIFAGNGPERTTVKDWRPYYNYTETRHYPTEESIWSKTFNVTPIITGSGPKPPPEARPNIVSTYPTHFNVPVALPIPYILTCIAFFLSLMDLYSRAIRSQAVPNHNAIAVPQKYAITAPLHVHDGITKIEDLPIVVAAPHNFTHPQ